MNSSDTECADNEARFKTILLLEPDISARMVLSEYLRQCGYTVFEGSSAEDAYKVIEAEHKLDIILSDVQLVGETDGFRLSQTLKKSNPEIDVVLTYGPNGAANKASDFCEDGPLEKPYHPDEVVRRIMSLRESRKREDA